MTIERLDASHERSLFDCGSVPLNEYLLKRAKQDQARGVSTTYVLVGDDSRRVIGYYSLAATTVLLDSFPSDIAKKLPRYPTVPGTLLARLAVESASKGQRFGERLLLDALDRSFKASQNIASAVVVVDAKDAAAAAFYDRYGFKRLGDDPLHLFLPMSIVARLFG